MAEDSGSEENAWQTVDFINIQKPFRGLSARRCRVSGQAKKSGKAPPEGGEFVRLQAGSTRPRKATSDLLPDSTTKDPGLDVGIVDVT